MKFQCIQEKIKHKFLLVEKITGRNLSLQVLGNILIETKKDKVVLRATNLDVGAELTLPAKVEKEGVAALNPKPLNAFLSSLADEATVSFELVGNNLSISTNKNNALIKTVLHDDFPTIPRVSEKILEIKGSELGTGLKSVLFSVSTSDIKPEIASVLFVGKNNNVFFTATDSFRLAEKKIHSKILDTEQYLIPHKNATDIVRFFEGEEGVVSVLGDKDQLGFLAGDTYVTTRITDGVYPDYNQIIPKTHKTQAVVLKSDLLQALRSTNIFADEFNKVRLNIIPEDKIMEIESKNTAVGEGTARIDAHLEGEPIEVSFNYRYLQEALQVIATDSVSMRFNESTKPLVVSGVGDPSFLYLVMPVTR